jgi:hypothetical protein
MPLGKIPVRGQDQCPFFIPPGVELKKEMSAVRVDRNILDLIYYQEYRLETKPQPLLDPVLRVGVGVISHTILTEDLRVNLSDFSDSLGGIR